MSRGTKSFDKLVLEFQQSPNMNLFSTESGVVRSSRHLTTHLECFFRLFEIDYALFSAAASRVHFKYSDIIKIVERMRDGERCLLLFVVLEGQEILDYAPSGMKVQFNRRLLAAHFL